MPIIDDILSLCREALAELDTPSHRASSVVRKAIRVARLREDYDNLWWLEMEMISIHDSGSVQRFRGELEPHYSRVDYIKIGQTTIDEYKRERRIMNINAVGQLVDRDHSFGGSLSEAESEIERLTLLSQLADSSFSQGGFNAFKGRAALVVQASQITAMLSRVEQRIHRFLSQTEHQLMTGQLAADVFQWNMQYVEAELAALSPEALLQLKSACEAMSTPAAEKWSHALLSCRRALKSVADVLYPATAVPVRGPDGKERLLCEEAYKNRLWQFVSERAGEHASGKLILASVNDLGNRVDRVYELSSKGVHAAVSQQEAAQCVTQSYAILGDILRLRSGDAALGSSATIG